MILDESISFEGFTKKIEDWYAGKEFELCDPPIDAQFALDLIFKTLVDDKEHYPYLTSMSGPISLMTIIIVAIGSRVIKSIFNLLDKIFNRGEKTR